MAQEIQVLSRHDLEAKIVKRCWENEEFRQEFTADPAGAFVRYLDYDPKNLPRIVVHEETPGSWHIVVPAKPTVMAELSDEDLERVAGGVTPAAATPIAGPLAAAFAGGGAGAAAAGATAGAAGAVAGAGGVAAGGAAVAATPIGLTITVAVVAIVTIGIAVNEGNKKKKKKNHW
jgi:hypothetical protein